MWDMGYLFREFKVWYPRILYDCGICNKMFIEQCYSWSRLYCDTGIHDKGAKTSHDDVIKWNHFLRYCPFVWGIHRSPVNSPHKGQWRGDLMFSLIFAWINGLINNHEAYWFETPSRSLWRHCNVRNTCCVWLLSNIFIYDMGRIL